MDVKKIVIVLILIAIGYVIGIKYPQWGAKVGLT